MKKHLVAVGLASACCAASADGIAWKFSGFGTLGGVVTNSNEVQYRANTEQNKGADKTPDFGVDSRLGLQANVKFTETFSAVGQLLTLRRGGTDQPNVEWLYGQATPARGLDLRAGRLVLPTFLVSDSRAVGYSAQWLRTPREVYDLYSASSFDGAQAVYRFDVKGYNVELQASLGSAKTDTFVADLPRFQWDIKKLSAISASIGSGDWTARIAQTLSRDLDVTSQYFVVGSGIRDAFSELAGQYDDGRVFALAEYAIRRQNQGGAYDSNSYYLSGGYRIGPWAPYATYGHIDYAGSGYTGVPDGKTTAVGVRWDVFKNVAIKAQFERTLSPYQIKATPAALANPPTLNVLSVVTDFIF